ncbi:AraC family transcriptional regulator [Polymorphum gilvum]|nr:AraC family transcriptional regulator [Polymorphum gilvum]
MSPTTTFVTKADLRRPDIDRPVLSLTPDLESEDRVLRGRIAFLDLGGGISVHFSNAEDLHDLKTVAESRPRLSVSIFLEGSVEASVGPMPIPMPRYLEKKAHWQPVATIFAQARTERFVRQAHKGRRLKKVTITLEPHWLEQMGQPDAPDLRAIRDFAGCHLACRSWTPSAHAVSLAEQIIGSPALSPFLLRLYVQSRVLGILEEAFAQVAGQGAVEHPGPVRAADRLKLQGIDAYLEQHLGEPVTADLLAREFGMSLATLQRLFAAAYGTSVSRYIRQFKLERARRALERDAVSVAEAAYLVGYGSPANFSTAFKRCFGMSPRTVQER